jgi:hypothetical protein
MTAATYLRVGRGVNPVYGDALRGWSPRADDLHGPHAEAAQAFRYGSLDELFFALVNLWATATVRGGGLDASPGH